MLGTSQIWHSPHATSPLLENVDPVAWHAARFSSGGSGPVPRRRTALAAQTFSVRHETNITNRARAGATAGVESCFLFISNNKEQHFRRLLPCKHTDPQTSKTAAAPPSLTVYTCHWVGGLMAPHTHIARCTVCAARRWRRRRRRWAPTVGAHWPRSWSRRRSRRPRHIPGRKKLPRRHGKVLVERVLGTGQWL